MFEADTFVVYKRYGGNMLKEVLNLYLASTNIHRLRPMNEDNYNIFMLKQGLPVTLCETKAHIDRIYDISCLYSFFAENPYFWIIPIAVPKGKIVGYILRGYACKNYRIVYDKIDEVSPLFGFETFKDYSIDTPIVVVEGCKDAIYLQQYYPYTVSLNTCGLTEASKAVLCNLTNRLILCYDNDNAGKESIKRDKELLESESISVDTYCPTLTKDWAEQYNINNNKDILYLKSRITRMGGTWKGNK